MIAKMYEFSENSSILANLINLMAAENRRQVGSLRGVTGAEVVLRVCLLKNRLSELPGKIYYTVLLLIVFGNVQRSH